MGISLGELDAANNHVSRDMDASPVELSDENADQPTPGLQARETLNMAFLTYGNFELTNVCCLTPRRLWPSVIQQQMPNIREKATAKHRVGARDV